MGEADDISDQLIDAIINAALQDNRLKRRPILLYKYLSDERVEDVLGNGRVRFTPLSNTNDLFEVRAPFKKFAGQILIKTIKDANRKSLEEDNYNKLLEKSFDNFIKQHRIPLQNRDQLFKYFRNTTGKKIKESLENDSIESIKSKLIPSLNSEEQTHKLLKAIGKLLCFSLSKQENISPMWAHYANHHEGFVIAFDTKSAWFKEWENGESKNLIKVPYFDGKMEEPLDNPLKAIFSKEKDWEYEREWRILAEEYQADEKTPTEEPIHLVSFPPEAVQRIILGKRIKPDVESRIKEIVDAKYPHAKLHRMDSNLLKSRMEEVKV